MERHVREFEFEAPKEPGLWCLMVLAKGGTNMVPAADNELMCRVGSGSAMGKAMRHFWLPALASSELAEAGADPVHVELMGESFVAFRDRQGNLGLLDEHCCHRGASLTVGRVE